MQAVGRQYCDKKHSTISYSEFKFKDIPNPESEAEPLLKLSCPTDMDSCQVALDPKRGQVSSMTLL